ncbi:pyrroline-5-carboxylate reductase [Alterisphingorhabdus coralli]|uniref:Pyrroline-5-carboxylate reductase n=1 Tax=Alterisphingorhabdus coralli TaxID=3071408 RepID=A0AA97I2D3_9SPHN|nr:pyrroline-5-carboxylate reductase [Parasphingorhabdus sp. SCSIO 66989]WOE76113.1 pyrroline-5-carboxylate reductase [Parasphingorhabdus sp. SCSIO 66989]
MPDRIEFPKSIGFIGCGNMAGAMLSGWLDAGLPKDRVTIISPNSKTGPGDIAVERNWPEGRPLPEWLVLGVKPQKLAEVADWVRPLVRPDTVVMSILAGVTHGSLKARFPEAKAIVRVMPNMAVSIGKSVSTGYMPQGSDADIQAQTTALMEQLGQFYWLDSESDMHAATALAGSGPAFLFRFIDALSKGAEANGIAPEQARQMALAMVEGAAQLAAMSEFDPGTLADKVASPGGVTRAGLNVLDQDEALAQLLTETLRAATERDAEMAQEFS